MEQALLIKQAKAGNKEALVALIMAEKQTFYSLAYAFTQNKEDALDGMEEMIVIVYEQIHRLKKEEAFYSWCKTILVNCCKKAIKGRKRVLPLEQQEPVYEEPGFQQRENRLLLETHLRRLSQKHQEVLRLRYYLDMEYEAIGEVLNIPVGTVKSRIHTGLARLKRDMEVSWHEKG